MSFLNKIGASAMNAVKDLGQKAALPAQIQNLEARIAKLDKQIAGLKPTDTFQASSGKTPAAPALALAQQQRAQLAEELKSLKTEAAAGSQASIASKLR